MTYSLPSVCCTLFMAILWFMRTHQTKWVYIGVVGFSIAFASHELTDIVTLVFVLFLVIAAFAYPMLANRANEYSSSRTRRGDEDVNPVRSAWQSLLKQKWTILGADLVFLAIFTILFTSLLTKFTYASQRSRTRRELPGKCPSSPRSSRAWRTGSASRG